jgi:hypothetical protein
VLERALSFQARVADREIGSRAELARRLGVSRAFISQAMAVLDAPPSVLEVIRGFEATGKPLTEGAWRRIRHLRDPAEVNAVLLAERR